MESLSQTGKEIHQVMYSQFSRSLRGVAVKALAQRDGRSEASQSEGSILVRVFCSTGGTVPLNPVLCHVTRLHGLTTW